MAGYGISDVPTIELADDEQKLLSSLGADSTQSALMAEAIILTDEWDQVIGPGSKIAAHRGTGAYHRAFSVLLFDNQKRLLLQRRASDKSPSPVYGQTLAAPTPSTVTRKWKRQMPSVPSVPQCASWSKNWGSLQDRFLLTHFTSSPR